MAKRKNTKAITLPQPSGLHTADKLTESDHKALLVACVEAQTAINEANKAAEIARRKDSAFKQLGMELLAKYGATGVVASTGALTRDPG